MLRVARFVLLACALSGCHTGSPPTDAPVVSATPVASESATPAPTPSASASASAPAPAPAREIGPSASEWEKAPAAEIRGGALLGCTARKASGFVLVDCGDPNYFGSAASRVIADPEKVRAGLASARSEKGRTRVVYAWNEGTALRATYDFLMPVVFEADWPRGEKEPKFVGRFRGVPDTSPAKVAEFVCRCVAKFEGKPAPPGCKLGNDFTEFGGALECLRAHYPSDCQGYRECITMEPSSFGQCERGEQFTGACPACRCAIQCGDGKPSCPPGMTCEASQREDQGKECVLE